MTIAKIEYGLNVIADTNILTDSFKSGYGLTDVSVVYLWVTFENSGILTLVRTTNEVDYEEKLNSGCALEANCAYMFPIMISEDSLNLKYSVDTIATYLQLREVF